MSDDEDDFERHSRPVPFVPAGPLTPQERAVLEAQNSLRQTYRMVELIQEAITRPPELKLQPWLLMDLNRLALARVDEGAGFYRRGAVEIGKSKHTPPPAEEVPRFVDEMCHYVNSRWEREGALHLASYVMWRLNWIHPFDDGNGRTTRVVAYYVLCVKLGFRPHGSKTIPELIAEAKKPYYEALEKADQADAAGKPDVSAMESYLRVLLATQLSEILVEAGSPNAAGKPKALGPSQAREETQRRPSASESTHWQTKAAMWFGVVGLLFLMVLALLATGGREVPPTARWLVVLAFSLSSALAVGFLGGAASAKGELPIRGSASNPLVIATTGGIATLMILIILCKWLFL